MKKVKTFIVALYFLISSIGGVSNVAAGGAVECINGTKDVTIMLVEGLISVFSGAVIGYFLPHRNRNNQVQDQNNNQNTVDVQRQSDVGFNQERSCLDAVEEVW